MSKPYLIAIVAAGSLFASPGAFVRAQTVTGVTPPAPATTVVVHAEKTRKAPHWLKAESQHFIIYSDAKAAEVSTLLGKLERFRYVLRDYAHLNDGEDKLVKTEIYYLDNPHDLEVADPDAPEYAIGLYKTCEEGTQAYGVNMHTDVLSKLPLEKQPENEGLSYIFEAYARDFFYQNDDSRTPTWFIDGFAHYFATARFDGNEAIIGQAPEAFATYLQRIGRDLTYSLDYTDVLQQKETNGSNYIGEAGVRNEYQARAWLLTHYILASQDNRKKFAAYLAATAKGEAPLPAFERLFGFKVSHLNSVLWKYMHSDLKAMKLNFKALPEASVDIEPMPLATEKLLLWQSALKSCPTPKYGARLLGQIRAEAPKFPGSDLAQTTLSRAEIQFGDPAKALPYLMQTTHDTPGSFEAQYLLGRAELALAETATGDARKQNLEAATAALLKATTIDPTSASDAYFFYRTQVLALGTPDEDASGAAVQAWQQAPLVDSYALAAGLVYARLGNTVSALHALHTVADDPRGRPSRIAVAKALIAQLQAGASDAALVAAMQPKDPGKEGGRHQWTMASGDILQAVQQAADEAETQGFLDDMAAASGQPN